MAFSFQRQKGVAITNAFQEMLDESNRKPKKIGEDKCREIYNRFMKSWLEENDTEMHSTFNETKFIAAERFVRTLKNKIYNI